MAGIRAVHKKDGVSYKFSGDLRECIEKARKELTEKAWVAGTSISALAERKGSQGFRFIRAENCRFREFHRTGKRGTEKEGGSSRTKWRI